MAKITTILMILTTVLIIPLNTFAQTKDQKEAGNSAMIQHPLINAPALKIESTTPSNDLKRRTIKAVLEKNNSPLGEEDIDEFMTQCTTLEMDCYLMPSIYGVESQWCKHIYPGSFNCNGWGGGYIMFSSYSEGIRVSAQALRTKYIDKGAMTVEGVGKIYASSGEWPRKVRNIMALFEAEEAKQQDKNQLLFSLNPVK